MKGNIKKWLEPVLFTPGGALAGYFPCPLPSHPLAAMACTGPVGWLLSGIFGKERGGKCNM